MRNDRPGSNTKSRNHNPPNLMKSADNMLPLLLVGRHVQIELKEGQRKEKVWIKINRIAYDDDVDLLYEGKIKNDPNYLNNSKKDDVFQFSKNDIHGVLEIE